jgi:DNA helicase-2/ATP-dependent DNA helicase PcrA
VALTRAEEQAYLTYTQNRYRWGKLIDAEPSRFIHEIDEKFVENLTPEDFYRPRNLLNAELFGEVDKSRLRQHKPVNGDPPAANRPTENQLRRLRKIRPQLGDPSSDGPTGLPDLKEGSLVDHSRFGKGKVLNVEGSGNDKKAEIRFERGEVKKLLLRFARLRILEE